MLPIQELKLIYLSESVPKQQWKLDLYKVQTREPFNFAFNRQSQSSCLINVCSLSQIILYGYADMRRKVSQFQFSDEDFFTAYLRIVQAGLQIICTYKIIMNSFNVPSRQVPQSPKHPSRASISCVLILGCGFFLSSIPVISFITSFRNDSVEEQNLV